MNHIWRKEAADSKSLEEENHKGIGGGGGRRKLQG